MCGRFTLKTRGEVLAEHFGLPEVPELVPRFNIAPSQPVAVVREGAEGAGRELVGLRWGLIPPWADDPAIGHRMINARAETVAERPAFRAALRRRRCLVVADGFYEWRRQDGRKQPFYFRLKDGGPFAFAGLWERWQKGDGPIESCTLITTEANDLVGPVHDRMPVVLDGPEAEAMWLSKDVEVSEAEGLLIPFPSERVSVAPANPAVNRAGVEGPELIVAADAPLTPPSDTLF